MIVYLATENPGKVHEMKRIFDLRMPGVELKCVADLPAEIRSGYKAEETGSTYTENALIKAKALARLVQGDATQAEAPWVVADARAPSVAASALTRPWVLAEDSGFEVAALGNAPGVYSARYAPTDKERCEKILASLAAVPGAERAAQFVACAVVMQDERNPIYFFGRHRGVVAGSRRGELGFGYDPIFVPDGETRTWGEVPEDTKLMVSHRGRALELAIQYMIARTSR
jgi:non-canonical purine NTP pyrophosphatase (RdgB/HAM1 family)